MRYLKILATVYAVLSLALGAAAFIVIHGEASRVADRIEKLQTDTNDNLCNQSAYQGGTTCQGGNANGGSLGF